MQLPIAQQTNLLFHAWMKAMRTKPYDFMVVHKAWLEYSSAARTLQKLSPTGSRIEMTQDMHRILDEELRKLPRHRKLTAAELESLVQSVSEQASDRMLNELKDTLAATYMSGLDDVSRELGMQIEFGGTHARILRNITAENAGLTEAFAGFSSVVGARTRDILEDAFQQGLVDIGRIRQQITDEIGYQFRDKAEMIARTESFKVWESARMMGYKEAEARRGESFRYRFGKVDDARTCNICTYVMDNIPSEGLQHKDLVDLIVRASTGRIPDPYNTTPYKAGPKRGQPRMLGSRGWNPLRDSPFPVPHPQCVVGPNTFVHTDEGKKPIRKVGVGDMVLTHKGRYRPVTQTHRGSTREAFRLSVDDGSGSFQSVTLTRDHPVLTSDGWKPIQDITTEDTVFLISNSCEMCGKPILTGKNRKYCSTDCLEDWRRSYDGRLFYTEHMYKCQEKWHQDPEVISRMTKAAHERTREMSRDGEHPFQNMDVRIRAQQTNGRRNYGGTWLEKKIGWMLKSMGFNPEGQKYYPTGSTRTYKTKGGKEITQDNLYFVDWYVPELDTVVECDGDYWHQDKDEEIRDNQLRKYVKRVVHFPEDMIKNHLDMCRDVIVKIAEEEDVDVQSLES